MITETKIRMFLSIFYPLFSIFAILFQFFLLFLIFKIKSKLLCRMRIYLLNICAAQLITICSAYFTQCRMIPNQTTVAFICGGMCTKFNRDSCFLIHLLRDASSTATLFALIHVFYYRYKILSHQTLTKHQVIRNFLLVHTPAIFCAICQFVNPSHYVIIKYETSKLHESYIFDDSSMFGFSNLTSPSVKASTIIFSLVLFINPIAAFIFRNKIWKLLNQYEQYSFLKIRHAKSMIRGLLIQTLLPCICFIPLIIQFFVSHYSGVGILLLEYFNSFLIIIPTLIDPLLSIIFIIPFRRKFLKYWTTARQCTFNISSSKESTGEQKQVHSM